MQQKVGRLLKAKEDFQLRHEIPFPHYNRLAGRPVIPSPLYERLKDKGAVFEEVSGHERPRWFARGGISQRDHYSFRRSPVHEIVDAEVSGVRNRVGIMDISAFAKVLVSGSDAAKFLDGLSANQLPSRDGGIVLSYFLNRRGRIEMELVIARIDHEHYYLVCAVFLRASVAGSPVEIPHNRTSPLGKPN